MQWNTKNTKVEEGHEIHRYTCVLFVLLRALRVKNQMVYLIGAGPGDPGLITVAGMKALQACTVVIYDALVNEALLDHAPAHAQRICMGKRGGTPSADQDEINELLIELACAGHTVARLKGGDPGVFARASEEMLALARAGIPFKVIPGVSSVLAAPAAANMPLTHRNRAAAFAVVTAHRVDGADAPDWAVLAKIDTLVVLMGAARAVQIADALMANGRAADTPAAAIQSATLPDEKILFSCLRNLGEDIQRREMGSPMVIVVGEVAEVGREIAALAQGVVHV
jgi:uroporphyrin-III C-methyltransferase